MIDRYSHLYNYIYKKSCKTCYIDKKKSYSNIVFFIYIIYTFTLNYTYWLINIITYTDYIDKSIYNNSVV